MEGKASFCSRWALTDRCTPTIGEVIDTAQLDDLVACAIENTEIPEQYRWDAEDENVSDEQRGASRWRVGERQVPQ